MRYLIPAAGLLALTGCQIESEFLQRMESQAKYQHYEQSEFFADKRAMRVPPEGTVPREHPVGNPALTSGRVNGMLVQNIPMPVTREVLLAGQKQYNIVCAQCHGVLGDGRSIVAENMSLRLPPNLVDLGYKPAGHFYAAIAEGYGAMPSFSGEIEIEDRWAVVAYVRALQAARGAKPAAPPAVPQENR